MDVGGDPAGAAGAGAVQGPLDEAARELDVLYVVNARRPLSDTPSRVLSMMDAIEQRSRIKISALVNNTNLVSKTTADDLIAARNCS